MRRAPTLLSRLMLAWPLAKRDLMARYRGSAVGLLWPLITPLAMVAVYALVFQGVFKARWGSTGIDAGGYAVRLFAGLIVFGSVAEVATRATRLVQDNANLVKRVVFPLELLCVSLVMQVAVMGLLQTAVLGTWLVLAGEGPRWSWLWLPAAILWAGLLQMVLALVLASIGCYVRDIQHAVPVLMSGLMFLSPVLYPSASAPPALRAMLSLNPLTMPIELARAAWFGDAFDWSAAVLPLVLLVLALWLAQRLFERLRHGFADLV